MGGIASLKLQIYACGYTEISEEFLVIIHWGFTPILPLANFRHKKTNLKRLVFLKNFGRHDRI